MSETPAYRTLLAVLLLWSLVPLPFLYIVQPPFWILALGVGAFLLWRSEAAVALSATTQNMLALAIIVAVVMAGGMHVGPLRPLGHLLLLLAAVRSVTVADRRGFLRALPVVVLVWVVAVASSTHIALAVYLVLSAAVWWWAGMCVHLWGLPATASSPVGRFPRVRHVAAAGLATMFLSLPVFLVMPRLGSPWVAAVGGIRSVSGFSEIVDLSGWRLIRESQEVAMVVSSRRGRLDGASWTRMRGTALDLLLAGTWAPRRGGLAAPPFGQGLVWTEGEARNLRGTRELLIELRRPSRYLFLPEGTVALRSPAAVLVDGVGGVVFRDQRPHALTYSVWVSRRPRPRRQAPIPRDLVVPRSAPEVRELARTVTASETTAAERAREVERFLQNNYSYSLNASAGNRPDPVAWFLLEQREGHCEFFAGSMVVMLRTLGIPARMVAGYSGGAVEPTTGEVLIREANAHAWVEAWCGGAAGWVVFDPTPIQGVPAVETMSTADRLRLMWERAQSGWDRYILTFGLGEQVGLVSWVMEQVQGVSGAVRPRHLVAPIVAVVLVGTFVWACRRPRRGGVGKAAAGRGPAAAAIERVARRLRSRGVELPPGTTVRRISRLAHGRWPQAAGALSDLAWMAEQELYAPSGRDPQPSAAVRACWGLVRRAMKGAE